VAKDRADVGAIPCNGTVEAELKVSPKTTAIASSPAAALDAHATLKREGRAEAKATKRALKAKRRTGRIIAKIRRHASLAEIAKGLWTTGSRPQGAYRPSRPPPPPSANAQQRRQAAQAIAGKAPGRCLTTTLAVPLGDKDPGIEPRGQTILEWLSFKFADPNHHKRVTHAWRLIFAKTIGYGNKRWRKVVGPTSAVQAILVDAGWDCPTPREWPRHPREGKQAQQTWLLPRKDCGDWEQRRDEIDPSQWGFGFCQTTETGYWNDATKHLDGEGLQRGGADVHAATNVTNGSMRKGRFDQRALNICAVAGAQWPRKRLTSAGYQADTACPRCGAPSETLMHGVWLCPSIRDREDYQKSAALLPSALHAGVVA
ncbi:unnamed protein product, partial [Prorocentrum cordatum]